MRVFHIHIRIIFTTALSVAFHTNFSNALEHFRACNTSACAFHFFSHSSRCRSSLEFRVTFFLLLLLLLLLLVVVVAVAYLYFGGSMHGFEL